MLTLRDLTFSYVNSDKPVLQRLNLSYRTGEFALVCGPTGSGKSTLFRALTGLVPHFSGGNLSGSISVSDGTDALNYLVFSPTPSPSTSAM